MSDRNDQELLKQQIIDIMNEEQVEQTQQSERSYDVPVRPIKTSKRKKKKHPVLKIIGITFVSLLLLIALVLLTPPGRSILYKAASSFMYQNMKNEEAIKEFEESGNSGHAKGARREEYVTNYLIFGIEEIGGARNTDSMMIATINTKADTLKLTSLLRDSYVEIPGYKANKLNSAYAKGGARLLVDTIELNYKIQIDGYVSVDFKSFEKIVDLVGGVDIELGKEEAKYLNTTNYISKKKNRNVKAGMNHLNGNQLMGYVRVRKVKTLGGANNDYGRIVRQQRAIKALFNSYMSPKNVFNLVPITKKSLSYVTTNLTQDQLERVMSDVVENKMTKMDTFRIPVDGAFDAPKKHNGVTYPIVLDWDTNRMELYQFIYSDTKEEAKAALQ